MNGRLAIYLRRRVAMQILALLAVLTAMMQMLELLDVTTEILERGQGVGGLLYYAVLRLPAELVKLDRFDLIILDDFSYARRDQAETSVLFELIAERYERKSIAITANAPFSAWDEVFPDKAMTVAAVDRLVHHSTILEMNVDSYRRRAALPARRQRNATPTP